MSDTFVSFNDPERGKIVQECEARGYKQAIIATQQGLCSMYHDPNAKTKNSAATWHAGTQIYGNVVVLMNSPRSTDDDVDTEEKTETALEDELLGGLLRNEE